MIYHRILNKSYITGSTKGQGMPHIPEHLSLPPDFSGIRVAQSLVFKIC
jgi:hypothetical protein